MSDNPLGITNFGAFTQATAEIIAEAVVVQRATVTLSAAQIKNWSGSSYPIIPAPGPGKLNQLIAITYQYKFGTRAYRGGISNFAMTPQYHLDPSGFGVVADSPVGNMFTATADAVFMCTAETTPRDGDVGLGTILQSGAENLSIDLFGSGPNLVDGAIATNHLSNAGSGYAPGDTGTINDGNSDAAYEVDTVDGGGAVLTYHLTNNGTGYAAPSFSLNTSATSGIGTGFSLIIDTITPAPNQGDGTLTVTAYYSIVTLSA